MSKWQQVKLGDIASNIQTGPFGSQLHQSDYSEIGTPVVMPKDLVDGKISEQSIARVEASHVKRLAKHKIQNGDILYSRRGDVGRCAYAGKEESGWLCGTGCLRVTIDESHAFPKFIFYQLQTSKSVGWVEKHAVGSTMLNLNTSILSNVPVSLPPLEVQRKIADVLSTYDDLIENNRKQIKLLEEAAQRLYKEWFIDLRFPGHEDTKIIDGIPEGWEKKSISAIAEYLNGFAFKPSDWQKEGKPIIKIKEMNQGISDETPRNRGDSIPAKYLIKAGDILFSWSATLSVMIWNQEDGWLNQHLFKVTPAIGISREFVLQAIANALNEFQNLTTGATMKHIQRGKLDEVFINIPISFIMNQFSLQAESIRNRVLNLSKQILNLIEAQNRLLSELMNNQTKFI